MRFAADVLLSMAQVSENRKELFLRACRFEPVERVPVWIMRQAGRYLPEYQAVRARHSFLEICKTPELAAEVSLQPFRVLDVDAIIVFSDILIVAEAMGMPLDVPDSGPVLSNPVRDIAAVRSLRDFDPNRDTKFVGDAIRAICHEAGPTVPVIGFAAAPWTLACYMIEGRTRGDISVAKQMLREQPAVVRGLLDRIALATIAYLKSQIAAGASVIQLFDTWAGDLSPTEYDAFELPATQQIFAGLAKSGVPKILFAKGSEPSAESAREIRRRRAERRLEHRPGRSAPHAGLARGAARKRGPEHSARIRIRCARCCARSHRENRRLGPHLESRPRNFANNAGRERESVRRGRGDRAASCPRSYRESGLVMNDATTKQSDKLDIGQISDDFLEKYNRPGPRYTSYPTAPVWKDDFGPDDFETYYARAEEKATPLSLYMHLPFCESLCLFCACNVSIQKDKSVTIPYLAALKHEIDHVARHVSKKRPVIQFHWGGGTPTYLSPPQMEDLFGYTRERFSFAPDAEIGIEVDPRVTNRAHLETLRRLGFNRLSMGIQDFQPKVQETIHRVQPYEMTRDLIVAARELGFESLNVDLIYGLPYQTADTFARPSSKSSRSRPIASPCSATRTCRGSRNSRALSQTHLPEGMEKFRIFRAGLETISRRGISLHRHGPLRAARR